MSKRITADKIKAQDLLKIRVGRGANLLRRVYAVETVPEGIRVDTFSERDENTFVLAPTDTVTWYE